MHVSLTERLQAFVKEKVESGLYNNSSEVIREALRLMEREDQFHNIKLERLKEAVRLGDEQLARGEYSTRTIDDIITDSEAAVKRIRRQCLNTNSLKPVRLIWKSGGKGKFLSALAWIPLQS